MGHIERDLSIRRMRNQRKYSLLIISVMLLACILLQLSFQLTAGLEETLRQNRRDIYGEWGALLAETDAKTERMVRANPFVEETGKTVIYGFLNGDPLEMQQLNIGTMDETAREREVTLETELAEDCILSCDGFWIREAVSNVLKNAIEYARPGSRVEVILKQEQNRYELRISDHGRRLESSDRERIFERFYQMDGSKKNSFGIGLHLSREIIGLHQGTLTVTDTGEEKTTFLFLLPKLITKDHSQTERRQEGDENSNQNGACE